MKTGKVVVWDRPKLERFKKEYEKHKGDRQAVFVFEGNEFLVAYAGYLIEYLDGQFEPKMKGRK